MSRTSAALQWAIATAREVVTYDLRAHPHKREIAVVLAGFLAGLSSLERGGLRKLIAGR